MNKINIFITFVAAALFSACASYNPQFKNPNSEVPKPLSKNNIDKTFYLIGNVGKSSENTSKSLQSLKNYIAENNS